MKIILINTSRRDTCKYIYFAGIAIMLLTLTTIFLGKHSAGYNVYYAGFLDWESIKEWFLSLGIKYNVNPWLFGGIYVGAIPFFTLSLGWLIKRIKKKESIVLPALSTGFFFISAYLYLIIVGQNVPIWVYVFVILLIIYGIYSIIKKIKRELIKNE